MESVSANLLPIHFFVLLLCKTYVIIYKVNLLYLKSKLFQ